MTPRRVGILLMVSMLKVAPGMPQEAAPDLAGREALMDTIEIALDEATLDPGSLDVEALDRVETLLAEFRRRYPATSRVRGWENGNEVVYLYSATSRLASQYERRGDFKKVVSLYEDELAALTMAVPHYSWRLIGLSIPLYLETGGRSVEELRGWALEYRDRFAAMIDRVEHPGRKALFAGLVQRMEMAVQHLDLIGKPAPDFTFTSAFNAETSLSLEQLRGRVVLIDFWATWCAPCMEAWPALTELRARRHDRGFEIASVTSLQGSFGSEKGLTPEREVELTAELVEKHGVSWPVLFSDRSVNDPLYGAATLPSYAIIDRDGRVERILVGEFAGLGEAIIERLLGAGG